jgi:hypothetical protein
VLLGIECRASDSPYVDLVWSSPPGADALRYSERWMTSVATATCELVVWEQRGQVHVTVQGPETGPSRVPVPAETRFLGITFALGVTMPHLPVGQLVDGSVDVPDVSGGSFWLKGSHWRLPEADDAEAFVDRLVRAGVLVRDPVVAAVLRGDPPTLSERTVQRRFLAATGLTRGAAHRIHRARQAAVLIQRGTPAPEVVHRLGYFDQPHLARSLTRFIGRTATQLADPQQAGPLSLLYKT